MDLNFPSYDDLKPRNDEQHQPDHKTLQGIVYAEARPLFDGIAHIIGQYATSHQEDKLRVFFEMMEESLNMAISAVTEGDQG